MIAANKKYENIDKSVQPTKPKIIVYKKTP